MCRSLITLTRIRHLQAIPSGWNLLVKQPLVYFFLSCRHPIYSAHIHLKQMWNFDVPGFVERLAKVNKKYKYTIKIIYLYIYLRRLFTRRKKSNNAHFQQLHNLDAEALLGQMPAKIELQFEPCVWDDTVMASIVSSPLVRHIQTRHFTAKGNLSGRRIELVVERAAGGAVNACFTLEVWDRRGNATYQHPPRFERMLVEIVGGSGKGKRGLELGLCRAQAAKHFSALPK